MSSLISFLLSPVVIRAERIAAGDHVGWNDLTYAAAPETCGQAIEVPEIILKFNVLLSPSMSEGGETGDQLARIETPGATKSGYKMLKKEEKKI